MSYSFANPNWASWIRTSECRSQSPVPYRLAIAHCVRWLEGFEPSASRATIWRANQLRYSHHAMLALVKSRMCPKGFEPPTHGLEGRCSIQLSYRLIMLFRKSKAGDGNRTHVSSLEGWCSTIELHPQDDRGDRIRTCDLLVPNQAL